MRTTNAYIGGHIERVEDDRFLRGIGQYVDDLQRETTWHAAVFRSSVAHGTVHGIDTSIALSMPGVRAVLTAQDIDGEIPLIPFRRPNPTIRPYAQPVIAKDKVRYFGEPLALVLADTPELAEDALAGIAVRIDALPPVLTRETCMASSTLLFDDTTSNVASVFLADKGDVEHAFQTAAVIVRGHFSTQRQTAMPIENRGLLAEWDPRAQHLQMHGAAKLPFFNRKCLAHMMQLPEAAVDYIEVDVGGGFGARGEFYPEDYLIAHAARLHARPVKWAEDRREHLTAIAHARESEADVELAVAADGTILGLRGNLFFDIGAYVRPNGMTPVRNAAQFMSGPYRVPAIHLQAHAYVSNKTPAGTFRGPGRYEGCFFMERLMEMAAAQLCMSPIELRRRNLLGVSDMPYPLAAITPSDGAAQTSCDSGDYRETLDQCLKEFGWTDKQALNGRNVDGRFHGVAAGCFIEGGASGPAETARMSVGVDGDVAVFVGSSAVGQGLETIMAQIAADALELPMERIRIFHGSTTYLKEGWGSYGSRSTVMGGSAVLDAAANLMEAFRSVAGIVLNVPAADLVIRNGVAHAPDGRSVPLTEAAKQGLSSNGRFDNSKATYTYGAAAAHVAVDVDTGRIEVLNYTTCDDVGRIINHLTLHGQVIGAVVQGLGSVFSEALIYDDDGTLLVGTLADYVMPTATDYPALHCSSREAHPSPNNPLGAKGAGEGGLIPVGGVIANAVAAALKTFNIQPDHLPLSPSRMWDMLQASKAAGMAGHGEPT